MHTSGASIQTLHVDQFLVHDELTSFLWLIFSGIDGCGKKSHKQQVKNQVEATEHLSLSLSFFDAGNSTVL